MMPCNTSVVEVAKAMCNLYVQTPAGQQLGWHLGADGPEPSLAPLPAPVPVTAELVDGSWCTDLKQVGGRIPSASCPAKRASR